MKKLPGIYIIYPQSKLIYDGAKDLIVKTRKIAKYLDIPIYLVDGRFCYGVVKLSFEKEFGVGDFKELFDRHRISERDRNKWWPKADKFYSYKIKLVEKFDSPRSWDCPKDAKTYVQEVNFIRNIKFSEITSDDLKKFSTKELVITSLKLTKAHDNEKNAIAKDKLVSHYLILWEELKKRNITQDKSTPLYKEAKKLKDKLEDYGFGMDFLDTVQRIGINAIFTEKYGMKITKWRKNLPVKRSIKMFTDINFTFYPQIVTRGDGKDEKNWYVEGFAATSDPIGEKDSEYPVVIPNDELDKAMADLKKRSTVFLDHKTEQRVGRLDKIERRGNRLWLKVFVSKTVPIIWKQVQEKVLNSFSIKAKAKSAVDIFDEKLGKMVRKLKDVTFFEVSLVGLPKDTGAKTLCWYVARAMDDMKGQEIVDKTKEEIAIYTKERMKLKDVFPDIAEKVARKYNKCADNLALIEKQQLIAEGGMVEGENAVICYITTGAQDRYNEILDPNGMIDDDYVKNPIVLWCHNHQELPVGKNDGLWQDEKGWIGKTVYAVDSVPQAKMNYQYRKDGNPLAISVGFIPLEWIDHNKEDDDEWSIFGPPPESGKQQILQRTYTKWILLEYSDVPVPANPECLPIVVLSNGFNPTEKQTKPQSKKIETLSTIEEPTEIIEKSNKEKNESHKSEEVTKMNDIEKKEEKKEDVKEEKKEEKVEVKPEEKKEEKEEKKEEAPEKKKEEKEEVKALTIEDVAKLIDEKLSDFKSEILKELKPEEKEVEEKKEEKKEEKVEEKEEKKEEKTEIKRETVIRSEEEEKEEEPKTLKGKLHNVATKMVKRGL